MGAAAGPSGTARAAMNSVQLPDFRGWTGRAAGWTGYGWEEMRGQEETSGERERAWNLKTPSGRGDREPGWGASVLVHRARIVGPEWILCLGLPLQMTTNCVAQSSGRLVSVSSRKQKPKASVLGGIEVAQARGPPCLLQLLLAPGLLWPWLHRPTPRLRLCTASLPRGTPLQLRVPGLGQYRR